MAEGRNFLAEGLSQREWNIVQDAKRNAERQTGTDLSNKEFLVAVCNRCRRK
ncbi:MAG: hypothetical protein ACLP74_08465 [Thermoplasmata archaeon]